MFVGAGMPRVDAEAKVRGRTRYADDIEVPGCWYGHIVRSPVSRGRLRDLMLDPGFDWSRVVVTTARDIPGPNVFVMHARSMPVLAEDEIRYRGEPLSVFAAPTLRLAREAAEHVRPDIAEEPAALHLDDIVRRFKAGRLPLEPVPGAEVLCRQTIVKGDAEAALAKADLVVEEEYTAGHQEQLYIEPQGLTAIPQPDGGLLIEGSLQCPYYVVHETHEALGLPEEKMRVRQSAVGGAFGGKEEFPSMLAAYCALPALKSVHPVRIVYDRHQDILFSTKRHPVWSRYRAGLRRDGTIAALKVDFMLDGGAYLTLSDVVMYRGILHAAMGYRCDHVFVNGLVVRTHTFPSGAFRGFGAPQAWWGMESHADRMARACGMPPHEFRLKNGLRGGDTTPTGQVLRENQGTPAVLEEALRRSQFAAKLPRCSRGRAGEKKWHGIGLSFFCHGAGFTGDGEAKIRARGAVDLDWIGKDRPGAVIRVSSTEMGQGAFTVLSQIAAYALSVDLAHVSCPMPDTAFVPNSGPTVASRTTMVVGSTVHGAARKLKLALEEYAAGRFFGGRRPELRDGVLRADGGSRLFAEVASAFLRERGPLRAECQFALPEGTKWDKQAFRGDAYPGYSWGCNVAEVEVDTRTCEIKVTRVTACYDIGRVINPVTAKGQVEGGLAQALGYAVMEKIGVGKDGRFDANRMQTYVIPTALDVPAYDITFVEFPYEFAEPGAKGVGEIPMDGLAPAIANALFEATGVRFNTIPITPERLFEALRRKTAKSS